MNRFKKLANKLVTKTFSEYEKTLSIYTVDGSCENGTAIDLENKFVVDGDENTEFRLVTNVDQWVKDPTAGNIDCVFDRTYIKILEVDKDAANAAYFLRCKTYVRKSIVIESRNLTPDGMGGFTDQWTQHATAEAEVTYSDATEAIHAGRVETGQAVKFYFRYKAGITEDMRVSFNGEYLPIRSVNNIHEAAEWIELVCEREKAT